MTHDFFFIYIEVGGENFFVITDHILRPLNIVVVVPSGDNYRCCVILFDQEVL